jgi:PKHD-type hydroxylase
MEFSKTVNFAWQFNLDKINQYAYWNNFLSKEECEKIITIGISKNLEIANTKNNNINKTRDSQISWLAPSDDLVWLYQRLSDVITELNNKFFNFDLWGIQEGLQFTNYKAPAGKYDSHVDRFYNGIIRKLSVTIQLSDENNYQGGDLELLFEDNPIKMKKEQGRLVIFPSFVLHRVTPVTQGERNSLVAWITGNNFK